MGPGEPRGRTVICLCVRMIHSSLCHEVLLLGVLKGEEKDRQENNDQDPANEENPER